MTTTDADPLIRVRNLSTRFFTEEGRVNAVNDVSFDVGRGDVFGIVGESGSGKSVTALSVLDLVESPGRITDGEIWYQNAALAEHSRDEVPEAVDGEYVDLLALPTETRRALRGPSYGMIFQDPMSSFNPTITVGEQIAEAVEVNRRFDPSSFEPPQYGLGSYLASFVSSSSEFVTDESRERALELLEQVGIPDPAERADEYPHQFSGGMLQRAMIAQALAGEPDLLIADEPTSALDVTIQAQILNLLTELGEETGLSIVLITHDLGVVARTCDRVGVMYAGEIVERGSLEDIFRRSVHPYTRGLLESVPSIERSDDRLESIDGNVPNLLDEQMPDRCYFADRCPYAMEDCLEKPPEFDAETGAETGETGGHAAACYLTRQEYDERKALDADELDDEAGSQEVSDDD